MSVASSWGAIAAIAAGAFALITAEFLPVGLLPQIANELGISKGQAGLSMTVPGIAAACSALLTISVAGKADRRYVLLSFLALMALSNMLVAAALGLPMLLAGRVLLGIAIGGFWTIGVSLGARLRPEQAGKATSLIFSGVTLGTVAGVPAGTLLGSLFGWRAAFGCTAAFAIAIACILARMLPVIPAERSSGLAHLPVVLGMRSVRVGLVAVLLIFAAQFAAYTYVSSFLAQERNIGPQPLSAILLLYGAAGLAGNAFCGWLAQRDVRRAVLGTVFILCGAQLLLVAPATGRMLTIAAMAAWGFGFGMLPVAIQSWMFRAAPDHMENAAALFVGMTQLAIGAGALAGGIIVDHAGTAAVLWSGATLMLLAAAWVYAMFAAEPDNVPAGTPPRM